MSEKNEEMSVREHLVGECSTPHSDGRLRWRCRRGMLELDLVLARFLGENYAGLTVQQQQEFEALLELEDQELWQKVRGEHAEPSSVIALLRGWHEN